MCSSARALPIWSRSRPADRSGGPVRPVLRHSPINSSTAPSPARRSSSAGLRRPCGSWPHPVSPALVAAGSPRRPKPKASPIAGGTYLAMEGPQFSTRPKSFLYESWGCAVIGMTNMPEAKLAREAEFATRRLRWSPISTAGTTSSPHVDIAAIIAVMKAQHGKGHRLVLGWPRVPARACGLPARVGRALEHRNHHAARSARPGADREARRDRGPRAGEVAPSAPAT